MPEFVAIKENGDIGKIDQIDLFRLRWRCQQRRLAEDILLIGNQS